MSRTSRGLQRLGMVCLAVATISAGVPALTGTAQAAAGPVVRVTLTPATATTPAGTCVAYTANADNASSQNVDAATITVTLQEGTTSASSTVSGSFCDPTTGAAVTSTANSAGQPTVVLTTDAAGDVDFGVVDAFQTGSGAGVNNNETLVTAFADSNSNRVRDGAEPFDTSTQTTTAAPTPNDVDGISATPPTASNVVGEAHTVTVTATDGGVPVAGITVSYVVTGVNPQAAKACEGGATNSLGKTTCTYTGVNTGADTIHVFVNQSVPGAPTTPGFDAGEPDATVTKTWVAAQGSRSLDLICLGSAGDSFLNAETTAEDCVNVVADTNRTFRAVVETTGTSGTVGTLVRFAVTGGSGDETAVVTLAQQTPGATKTDCTTVDFTSGAGDAGTSTTNSYCDVVINDPTPVSGEVLTVLGTVRGTSVADSGTLTYRNVPADARNIAVTPDGATSLSGSVQVFTALVTDANGRPVQGVVVNFTETGAGFIRGTATATTDAAGRAFVDTSTATAETGLETVTGTIASAQERGTAAGSVTGVSQCGQAAGAGTQPNGSAVTSTTTAGNCSDTGSTTWSPTAPPPSPDNGGRGTLSTSTPDIQPNIQGVLLASGLTPNAAYELRCYSRPSTTYFTARSATTSATGTSLEFRILPGTNTRCYVRPAGNESLASNSVVINVHTTLSLSAVRTGVRTYIFQGRNLPRRSGQLITLYRVAGGQEIRTSNLVTDASGIYRVTRTFTGTGTFQFRVRTSQTLTNAPGASNVITVNVH